tara:strand:+ start:167612 stop:175687 length:8076 start_codon:yes stop_codon:yes gene_type:complete
MSLTPKTKKEVLNVYDTWLHSYLNGDVATYDSYFDDTFHFIGSTANEEFLNRKDTTRFFEATAEQLSGKSQLRNETKILEQFGELVFITHLFDAWFLAGDDWSFYSRFRFSNALQNTKKGWKFIYQHYSTPDSKAQEGETIGFDQVTAENLQLREAIQRRTKELEEKNRELEIEGALERIRAQAVAMKETADLLDIVVSMRTEFTKLGHEAHYFWHMMWLPETYEKAMTSGDGTKIGFVMELPRHIHGNIPVLANWEKSKKPTVVYAMKVEEALDYIDKMVSLGDFKHIDPQAPTEDDIRQIGGLTFIMARTTHGEIGYSLPGVVKDPPKEDVAILVKFAGVFDLAHRRFLDLQKAEKQARETLVELSLERIRSRVTAMKESSDLFEIVVTMRNEFLSLGHEADYFWHMKWLKDTYEMSMTAVDGGRLGMVITVPKFVHDDIPALTTWEKGVEPTFVLALDADEAWNYIENMNTHGHYQLADPNAPTQEDIQHIGGLTFIIARTTHGEIGFSLAGKVTDPSKASVEILMRFAQVFDLAYKRFEDLQKAEKQKRETQIELALEKVRSRTMAMQHSDELQEASFLLDQQVRELGIKTWGCAFNIYGEKESTEWFGNEAGVLHTYTVPHEGIFKKYYQKGKKGDSLFIQEFSDKECIAHYEYMSSLPVIGDVLKILKNTNNGFPTYQIDHVVYFKYGYLLFITREHVPDAHDIFKRFAKVFEQTYTRFLDLKKAEAQAKEAKIETALEKVRSRSLAMQNSEELKELIGTVYKELNGLDMELDRCLIWIMNDDDYSTRLWMANREAEPVSFYVQNHKNAPYRAVIKGWKERNTDWEYHLKGNVKKDWDKFVFEKTEMKHFPEKLKKMMQASDHTVMSGSFHSFGCLQTAGPEGLSNEQRSILTRFAKVFNQAYTRFSDLKKAEAQAREAQIETALERVRSRSMAMHNSEELKEVIQVLYDQFVQLNINIEHAGFILDYKDNDNMHIWLADENAVFPEIVIPYFDCAHWNSFNKAKNKGDNFFANQLDFEEKNKFYKDLFECIPDVPEDTKKTYFEFDGLAISTVLLDTVGVYIENYSGNPFSDEENDILLRFGKVFQQTYTRFLDLQKAEALTREAQIELGLERLRARAMAMQHSDELSDLVATLLQELTVLDFSLSFCIINIYNEPDQSNTVWAANPAEGKAPESYYMIFEDYPFHHAMMREWKAQTPKFVYVMEGEEKELYDDYLYVDTEFSRFPKEVQDANRALDRYVASFVFSPFGGLQTVGDQPLSEKSLDILYRFGKVFNQTYTRFIDLQKAEVQAREAQIENALEKVRSRTMAMQHSDELPEAANVLFTEVQNLGIPSWSCGYNILSEDKKSSTCIMSSEGEIQSPFVLPLTKHKSLKPWHKAIINNKDFFMYEQGGKELEAHYEYMQSLPDLKETFQQFKDAEIPLPTFQVNHLAKFTNGFLLFITYERVPEAHVIFKRFGKVFEQTYTRFLDLQKAEAQAKEAQIEAALERVRSRSMAMHKSDEIGGVAFVLFQQLKSLGGKFWGTGFGFCEKDSKADEFWFANENGIMPHLKIPNTKDPAHKQMHQGWKKNLESFSISKGGKELKNHYKYMLTVPDVQPIFQNMLDNGISFPKWQKWHAAYFKYGYLLAITTETYENEDIFKRFAKVFEQAYTRFLDLQKAEAQAREAQIEAALEKVRSRSLAMHTTNELQEVVAVVAEKLKNLGVIFDAGGVILCTYFPDKKDVLHWIAADDFSYSGSYLVPYFEHPIFDDAWDSKHRGDAYFSKDFSVQDKNSFFEYAFEHSDYKDFPDGFKQHALQAEQHRLTAAWSKNSAIIIPSFTEAIPSESDAEILKRFAKVFEQAYIRFMDLQKSEERARKSQIDIALERVRARAMAMHQSNELSEAAEVLYQEFYKLGVTPFSCGYLINDNENNCWEVWMTDANDESFKSFWTLPFDADHHLKRRYKSWKNKEAFHVTFLEGEENTEHHKVIAQFAPWKLDTLESLPNRLVLNSAHFTHGHLLIVTGEVLTPEEASILTRFAKVFEQAYIRFTDLQKAEKQAKEAKIEASLEKVRTVALTLKKSDDMLEIAQALYEQLLELGFNDIRNAIIDIHNDETETFLDYDYSHDMSSAITEFSYHGDPVIEKQIKQTQSANDAFFEIELKGDQLKELIETRIQNGEQDDPRLHETDHLTYNLYSFGNGAIGISNFGILSDEQKKVLKRFRNVFTFAYKRYTDLANAEAQAMEAKIEASLEKVRNVALGMKQSDHLLEIVQALYEQLLELGFTDIRNALIDVNNEDDETFMDYDYSHEMGGTVTKMSYSDDPTLEEQLRVIATTTDGFSEMILKGQQLKDLIEMRRKNGEADDPRLENTDSISYILYAFGNGAIGISNFGVLNDTQKAILDRFRNVFIFAYQRYNDLAHTEEQAAALLAEKQRLEKTLTDLQQTQKQLIQSEKMASLGELTAGIAHEIQNPLNFVNNFSEVSNELIEEIDEEMTKGDMEEVKLLLKDIKQNLEKINHHGKRADAIVKGMLQHSRKSTADKVPTDINKLADEYLRLAYHGLRAKDKSFNATLETDFDESIGLVQMIPQDMGRVILNLITNAFYATNERKNTLEDKTFKPTVSVVTRKLKNTIEISVKDNGNGIPKQVVDKIFQPFFTTKPTGKGTGLGLSMSYDIVKSHGGELKVKTKEGTGTTFMILIPTKK